MPRRLKGRKRNRWEATVVRVQEEENKKGWFYGSVDFVF